MVSSMLRIHDERTGSAVDLWLSRRRLARLCVHADSGQHGSTTLLRALLLADVITRIAELRGAQVLAVALLPDGSARTADIEMLKAGSAALNIHPPAAFATPRDAAAHLDGPADLHITDYALGTGPDADAPWLRVGPVQPLDALETPRGSDPLAARLALLSAPYQSPISLSEQTLAQAHAVIAQWRDHVARWAAEPSRPPHRDTVQRCEDALNNGLDTAQALATLRTVALSPDIPGGAKFETFAHLDRILGLDLTQDIGRPRG
jgi:hypothetical protein